MKKYKQPKQLILRNPKKKFIIKEEIQPLQNITLIGRVFQINILKSMLKREKVKKITLTIE